MYYVYILYSEGYDKYYRGYSEDPYRRLEEHNLGMSRYTSHYLPWELVHLESYEYKTEALKREKVLKKYSKYLFKF